MQPRGIRRGIRRGLGIRDPAPRSATLPILPDDDERAGAPILWIPPLTERLIRLLHTARDWSTIGPRQLEEVVAELLDGFGYEVELTQQTRDGGRDIIAIRHHEIKSDKYLIECKHREQKIGVSAVRELLGVGQVERASGLILASTSGFSKDARILSAREDVKWILALKDQDALQAWVESYARLRGWIGGP